MLITENKDFLKLKRDQRIEYLLSKNEIEKKYPTNYNNSIIFILLIHLSCMLAIFFSYFLYKSTAFLPLIPSISKLVILAIILIEGCVVYNIVKIKISNKKLFERFFEIKPKGDKK